ncbi:serine/threonine-protein phosphatase [Dermacoccus nishinomiyaensis]|uniref:PP2C family protein-serine/threonine phosphatase n=1 Tax=Dermacoccus nishinomiyaensis TaxID=1274 RepID=UPI000DFC5107|nr:protein phosphatase 2C domain-containing protein [Dermacoccus nishinomiyaensis]QQY24957.1 serine/threonine-protein phosphatase [Dermacoccus nishinomiyaensis]STD18785.1 PP2C-family Ser/Thr phosphatase [Dermacoccus nishinomiyaensis]
MPIALRYAARSDVGLGSKKRNEDSAYASSSMLVLADGMGGHAAGDVASSTVVGELVQLDGDDIGADDALDQLADGIAEANEKLRSEMDADPTREGMGTTLIVLLKTGRQLAMANIGDSRAYQLRDGKFTQITKDHSFVQSLLDSGRITPDEAVHHPQRSLVTRVLTGREGDVPDLSLREARVGDRYLLCSDGLSDYVGARTIEEIFTEGASKSVGEVADSLIEIALKASTLDNVTVVVAEVANIDDVDLAARPDVVGAAVAHGLTQSLPTREQTPAEKARALSRELDGDDEPDETDKGAHLAETRPRRRGRLYAAIAALVLLLALAVAAVWGWTWSHSQYFIKDSGGRVTVYQGVDSKLGPIDLRHQQESTNIPTADLPEFWRSKVTSGIDASSEKEAAATVERLRAEMVACLAASASGNECTK